MHRLGEHFLTHAGLAVDQDGRIGTGKELGALNQGKHARVFDDHGIEGRLGNEPLGDIVAAQAVLIALDGTGFLQDHDVIIDVSVWEDKVHRVHEELTLPQTGLGRGYYNEAVRGIGCALLCTCRTEAARLAAWARLVWLA